MPSPFIASDTKAHNAIARRELGKGLRLLARTEARGGDQAAFLEAAALARTQNDRDLGDMLERAAVNVGNAKTPGWAAEIVGDFNLILGRQGLVGTVLERLMSVSLAYPEKSRLVEVAPGSISVGWVAEGSSKPATAASLKQTTLAQRKAAAILVLTAEVLVLGATGSEAFLGAAATLAAQLLFDSSLLDDEAATDARPAGLRYGVTPTAYATSAVETLSAAIEKLPASPAAPVVIARPADLLRLSSALPSNVSGITFVPSSYAPAGLAVIVDPYSVMFTPSTIRVNRSGQSTITMDDGNGGTLGPVVSLWQENMIALKVEGWAGWQVVDAAGVQVANLVGAAP